MPATGASVSQSATSALQCLVAVCRHNGLETSVDELTRESGLDGAAAVDVGALLALARRDGRLRARAARLTWDQLLGLRDAFPVLIRFANGNWALIAGFKREGAEPLVGIVDPLAGPAGGLSFVERKDLLSRWEGDAVLLKRRFSLGNANQPFGLRWFLAEALTQRGLFRDIALAAAALHVLSLALPVFFQIVIDKVLVHRSHSTLAVVTAGVLIALVFDALFSYLRQYLLLRASNRIDMRLSRRTFAQLLALPLDFFERHTAGVLVRHMQQVERIRQFLTGRLFLTVLDSAALVVLLPVLSFYSGTLTLIVLGFTALIAMVMALLVVRFRRRLLDLYKAEAERQAMLVEAIHGIRTVKSLAVEATQQRRWEDKTAQAIAMHFSVGGISITAQALTGMLEKTMLVTVIAAGAYLIFDERLSPGALVAFQMLAGRVISPLVQVVSLVSEYQETAISVEMLGGIMNAPPETSRGGARLRPRLAGALQLDRVTFRYPGRSAPALDRVSLAIPAGKVLGVVGRSGSGKTTLARLMQGIYLAQEGVVRVDGVDIREIEPGHVRRNVGIVLQDSFLFRGSVRENIALSAPSAPPEAVVAAARLAGADEFIEQLPGGYDTPLEENASNLSGGQRQRLAIARALLGNPRILIFDEASSALDPESEAIFMENLFRMAAGRTVIIISHRMTTLTTTDAVAVLDEGRIVDVGKHAELLARCELYRRLWERQTRFR